MRTSEVSEEIKGPFASIYYCFSSILLQQDTLQFFSSFMAGVFFLFFFFTFLKTFF